MDARKLKNIQGAGMIPQLQNVDSMDAQAVSEPILTAGRVVTDDTSAAGVLVRKYSLLRIQVAADTYIAFGASSIGAVSVTTSPALKLAAGYYLVRASADYIRTSANVARLEVVSED